MEHLQDQDEHLRRMGKVLLLSSGELASSGREMQEYMFKLLPPPIQVAIMETPAGFELNSEWVARRVADFISSSLQEYHPSVTVVPARRQDGPFSTNEPAVLEPILEANYLFLGPGSPTYTVRHLKDSLAMRYLVGRHRAGATLCFASAAAIAFGAKTLPVYEIFKAGHDLYWADGFNFFGDFGLELAIVTHWDNREGGPNLDTSHCFMGRSRMEQLRRLLPPTTIVLGIDEHTGVVFDFQAEQCQVIGKGGVMLLSPGSMTVYETGAAFPIQELGPYRKPLPAPTYGPPVEWRPEPAPQPPAEVIDLVQRREELRRERRWSEADRLREQVAARGFEIQDTDEGPRLRYKANSR